MRLEMMTAADVEIRIRSETDPVMMAAEGDPRGQPRCRQRIDFTYAGRRLQCNRWRIELWPAAEMEDARG